MQSVKLQLRGVTKTLSQHSWRVSSSLGATDALDGLADPLIILGGELDVESTRVFLQIFDALGAGNGKEIWEASLAGIK